MTSLPAPVWGQVPQCHLERRILPQAPRTGALAGPSPTAEPRTNQRAVCERPFLGLFACKGLDIRLALRQLHRAA